jgi:hypothetical protein
VPESSSCTNGSDQTQYNGGDVTIYNGGSGTVNVTIQMHGYFISPTTTDIAGDEYEPISEGPVQVCSTRNAGCTIPSGNSDSFGIACVGTGGQTFTGTIPSDGCINIQVAGVDGVPSGESAISAEVTANYSTSSGWLDIAPYEESNGQAQVNFSNSYGGDDEAFENAAVTSTSDGAISIYNDSSGTVDVTVSVRGTWDAATSPDAPGAVVSTYSDGQATVAWSIQPDGGSPITEYDVTTSSGYSTQVGGSSSSATVEANASDTVTVTASNVVGSGPASGPVTVDGSSPLNSASFPMTLTGEVDPPLNSTESVPSGLAVTLEAADAPDGDTGFIGTTTTGAYVGGTWCSSCWSYTIPALSSLSGDVQDIAASNGGYLNVAVDASGFGTPSGNYSVAEDAYASESVYLGSGTSDSIDPPADLTAQLQPTIPETSTDATDATTALLQNIQSNELDPQNGPAIPDGVENDSVVGETTSTDSEGSTDLYDVSISGENIENAPITPQPQLVDPIEGGQETFEQWNQSCEQAVQTIGTNSPSDAGTPVLTSYWTTVYTSTANMPIGIVDSGVGDEDSITVNSNSSKGASYSLTGSFSLDGINWQVGGGQKYTVSDGSYIKDTALPMTREVAYQSINDAIKEEIRVCNIDVANAGILTPLDVSNGSWPVVSDYWLSHYKVVYSGFNFSNGGNGSWGSNSWPDQCAAKSYDCDGTTAWGNAHKYDEESNGNPGWGYRSSGQAFGISAGHESEMELSLGFLWLSASVTADISKLNTWEFNPEPGVNGCENNQWHFYWVGTGGEASNLQGTGNNPVSLEGPRGFYTC